MVAAIFCTSCGREDANVIETPSVEETSENPYGSVSLSEVGAPVVGETFFRMTWESNTVDVTWGLSQYNGAFCWSASGFPGFDCPVIVEIGQEVDARTVIVETEYGKYVYALMDSYECFAEDGNFQCTSGGELLVQYGRAIERLFVWQSEDGVVSVYRLVEGTEITL